MSGLPSRQGRSRLAKVLPSLANLVISHVPGVQAGLYLAGAMIIGCCPVLIPSAGRPR